MAKTEQQRQKKLAKKRSKELKSRRELARRNQIMSSMAGKMQWASQYPVYSCIVSEENQLAAGMRTVCITRKLPTGQLAAGFFLLDLHCLGVKDAFGRFCTPSELEEQLESRNRVQDFKARPASYARKLVEDAVAYAASIGLPAAADYPKVAAIFGDIDASECKEEFTFGLDGKPSYYPGPYDDQAKQTLIYNRLSETVGKGNFHFTTVGGPSSGPIHFLDGDVDDDDDFDDEVDD